MSAAITVQIFGVKNSPATRAAERFFKERRVTIHMVDLKQRPMSPGEIKRFLDRYGWSGLLDTEGKSYEDAGLKYLRVSDSELLGRIERDPKLLRLPLVRGSNKLAVGQDEDSWKRCSAPRLRQRRSDDLHYLYRTTWRAATNFWIISFCAPARSLGLIGDVGWYAGEVMCKAWEGVNITRSPTRISPVAAICCQSWWFTLE
jgi:arsenate reductase-like glutaredoxin family protein